MRAADALIDSIAAHGVDTVFGVPGGAALPIYDALAASDIRHVLTRHEAAAGHAAEGWARVTGRPGVALATSGPGAVNLLTAVADAWMDSVPTVFSAARSRLTSPAPWRSRRLMWPGWRFRSSSTRHGKARRRSGRHVRGGLRARVERAAGARLARDSGRRRKGPAVVAASPTGHVRDCAGTAVGCGRGSSSDRAFARPVVIAGGGVVASGPEVSCQNCSPYRGPPVCHDVARGSVWWRPRVAWYGRRLWNPYRQLGASHRRLHRRGGCPVR